MGDLAVPIETLEILAGPLALAAGYMFSWGNAANWVSIFQAIGAAVL